MNSHLSSLFSRRQLKGLQKLGDVMMPAGNGFPSFSQTGCIQHVDIAMGSAHPDDVRDFGYLLLLLHYAPKPIVTWIVKLADQPDRFPEVLASQLRKLNIGIKGVVVSLYYSGKTGFGQTRSPLDVIEFSLTCKPLDQ